MADMTEIPVTQAMLDAAYRAVEGYDAALDGTPDGYFARVYRAMASASQAPILVQPDTPHPPSPA